MLLGRQPLRGSEEGTEFAYLQRRRNGIGSSEQQHSLGSWQGGEALGVERNPESRQG